MTPCEILIVNTINDPKIQDNVQIYNGGITALLKKTECRLL